MNSETVHICMRVYNFRHIYTGWPTVLYALTSCALASSNIDRFSN